MPANIELVVTSVATRLMAADAATSARVTYEVLGDLVSRFGVDGGILAHRTGREGVPAQLVAAWPVEDDHTTLAGADRVLAGSAWYTEPTITQAPTWVVVPLRGGDVTTGVLAFTGARDWSADELNALRAIASLFAQVQARVIAEQRLRLLADRDDLTGLHNRRALLSHLADRLAEGSPGPVAMVFFDLDRLKSINDYLGHSAGDWFIQILAERLVRAGGDHFVARLGGDEFVVVPAAATASRAAEAVAEHLRSILGDPVAIDGELLTRTVSIGVAVAEPGTDTPSDLLSRADQAVMAAKSAGGNRLAAFSESMSRASELRNDIELHLQNVVDSGALVLHYLPEFDMRTGEVLAAEALVRWQHPTRGLLYPDSFIGVAESINLAGDVGRWVLRNACAQFAQWRAQGLARDIMLRVNVSPVQLVTEGFAQSVAAVLAEFGLERGSVCLEITESVVVQDIETTQVTLAGIKEAGLNVAIDDFGTGYSVLSLLKTLPVDTLKIDKSFVCDLGANARDLAIVRAIIALAEAFGLELVAEGVETGSAAMTLLQHGCHRAQGFLLSRPIDGTAMERLLAEGRVAVDFSPAPTR
ncbi:putative bifunctional diguanylate cyclase/phosphodiesterase [Mycobacterium sp. WMMD1722]|uniref:putative bifunctional diguanylate cyclase/phosphodiesterase n=1 Tax=Mycobacterium sp. WMMD1722 TaxID=3404117 RepID=UPI003BF60D5A